MILQVEGGLGDTLAVTPVLKKLWADRGHEPRFVSSPHPEVFVGNPYLTDCLGLQEKTSLTRNRGEKQQARFTPSMGQFVKLNPMWEPNEKIGNLALSYAKQVGIKTLADTTPEVFLDQIESVEGWKTLHLEDALREMKDTVIAVDPWASWPSRRWEFEKFKDLVWMLKDQGYYIVEMGSKHRYDCLGNLHDPSKQDLEPDLQLHGRTTIREAAAVLKHCSLFLGNDSGLMHLAAAVGTPQAVVYANKRWYSRAYWNTTSIFSLEDCHPQCLTVCGQEQGKSCLERISSQYAFEMVELALERFGKER